MTANVLSPRTQKLQILLEELLGSDEVHFQPPLNLQMSYTAIVYKRDNAETLHADNIPYRSTQRYQLMVISRMVDDPVLKKIAALPMCRYDRFYTANNLNHDVYTIFF